MPYVGGSNGNGRSFYVESDNSAVYSDLWVESPVFDLSGLSNPVYLMDIKYDLTYDWCDRAVYVQYSLNGGTSWTTLGTNADPNWYTPNANTCWPNTWSGGIDSGWTTVQNDLCDLIGETCVKFRVYGDDLRYLDRFAFDNVRIEDRVDVGVTAFVEPVTSSCLLSATQPVTITVYNYSCAGLTNIPVECVVNGPNSYVLTGTVPGPLPSGGSVNYTFTPTIDMTTVGTYNFTAYTQMAGDINTSNDTATTTVTVNNLLINTFPHVENFNANSGVGVWTPGSSNVNNYWNWGALPGGYLGGAATNCWYMVRDGTSTYNDMWVESPVFDFSAATNPVLTFEIQYDLSYDWCDRAVLVQYTTNGGTPGLPWVRLLILIGMTPAPILVGPIPGRPGSRTDG